MRALFKYFPRLEETLPHVMLADLPTPVERLDRFGEAIGTGSLYIKRDDLSAPWYGGNKVRKLEFLLGEALRNDAREVMTFGCAGSNHATATAIYARMLGLHSISMLLPQPNARSVRRNLLLSHKNGAEIHMYKSSSRLKAGVILQYARHRLAKGREPYLIPPGGSSPLGCVGYVNAAFELRQQIEARLLPEPDVVYVAAGTTGTAVGLMLGLRAAGLRTQVMLVRVTAESFVNSRRIMQLLGETNALLEDGDPSFPGLRFDEAGVSKNLRHDFYGEQYGLYTDESVAALRLMKDTQGIVLEGTYTGKACAALISDARRGLLKEKTALFWNTYNSRDLSPEIANVDYHNLPKACHRYFEEEVQPLDRE